MKFEGTSGQMRDSQWLASEDLDGLGEVEVIIEQVNVHHNVTFDSGKEPVVYSLSFQGRNRELVLNATNRKVLVRMYGTKTSQWEGKPITLYVQDGIKAFGKTTKGIRIKYKKAAPAAEVELK